jgi:hypothetical protein
MIANAQSRAEIETVATQIRTSSMSRERLVGLLEMIYEFGRIDQVTNQAVQNIAEAEAGIAKFLNKEAANA